MRVLSTEIKDILSIHDATINFEDSGLILVEGWNYDTQRANAAGKTAIFNCLAFSLYDRIPRKVTVSEILRRGCKTGFVKTRVLCGNDVWTVIRSRPKGAQFFKNDIEQNITQEEFESFLRLSYEQFLLTIYTPQANSGRLIRFLSCPDTAKKEFLLQLLNLDQFSGIKKDIDTVIAQIVADLNVKSTKISNYRAKLEIYEESVVDVDSINSLLSTLNQKIAIAKNEIVSLQNIVGPDLSKYSDTEKGIKVKLTEIIQAKTKRSMLQDRYRQLSSSIHDYEEDATCTKCGSSLDTEEARSAHTSEQSSIKDDLASIKNQLDSLDLIISKEHAINDLAAKLSKRKNDESAAFNAAQKRIIELNSFIALKTQEINSANAKINTNSELQNKIQLISTQIEELLISIEDKKKELELYKTLSAIYSPTGAQAYVLDSIIDSFNEVIQKYIDMMSPDMTYVLNSFKENTKGDVVAKFSETLTKSGDIVSVGSLSGGEEKGLSLCVDFALLEVLETQFGMTLNPIILDEPFDGLDMAGREIIINLLESIAQNRQIFIIDHASESKTMFTKFIKAELRNGITTLNVNI